MKKIILILSFCFCLVNISAQEIKIADIDSIASDPLLTLSIPPIGELLDGISTSAVIGHYEARTKEAQEDLDIEKHTITQHIRVLGSYQYGRNNINSGMLTDFDPTVWRYTNEAQNLYSVGLSMSIPFSEFIGKRSRIDKQKARIDAASKLTNAIYDEQRIKVIDCYTEALNVLNQFKVKSEAAVLATAQFRLSERDFMNNRIDIQELSRLKSIQSIAVGEYFGLRSMLYNVILKLEVFTGVTILDVSKTAKGINDK